jgi:acetamidase/formamidase
MSVHEVLPERRTLHGHFSADLTPVLEVDPGDTIRSRTLHGSWAEAGFERDPILDKGHPLVGPIFVRGAAPGDALAVEILRLRPANTGSTVVGGMAGPLSDRLGLTDSPRHRFEWKIDSDLGIARGLGFTVDLRPFLGVIGLAPGEPGIHSTIPPRPTGGNIDCRELVAGSRLLLPVEVAGGLLSFGDGHAAQGDGEVAGTALECAMSEVELRVELVTAASLKNPEAHTPAGFITFGFSPSLNEAMLIAVEAMIDHLQSELGIGRLEAMGLATVAVDVRVTQVVNQVMGVHAVFSGARLRPE